MTGSNDTGVKLKSGGQLLREQLWVVRSNVTGREYDLYASRRITHHETKITGFHLFFYLGQDMRVQSFSKKHHIGSQQAVTVAFSTPGQRQWPYVDLHLFQNNCTDWISARLPQYMPKPVAQRCRESICRAGNPISGCTLLMQESQFDEIFKIGRNIIKVFIIHSSYTRYYTRWWGRTGAERDQQTGSSSRSNRSSKQSSRKMKSSTWGSPWQFVHRNLGICNIWARCTVQ